jgi:hypothetical protein
MKGLPRRWHSKLLLLLVSSALGPACSDDANEVPSYCATLQGRQQECGVLSGPGRTSCLDYDDAPEPCETACVEQASCADIVGHSCGTPADELLTCLGRCLGLEPVTCEDGTVLPGGVRCNGVADCGPLDEEGTSQDTTDEADCESPSYKCRSEAQWVPFEAYCDGREDCADGSDETPDCELALTCSDGTEVPAYAVCDGITQCIGGEDEPDDCAPRVCE